RITSATMNARNFSAKTGSRPASSASARSRAIWPASRAASDGGSPSSALSRPTCLVHLTRSASRCTRPPSMLSMLPRRRTSSGGTPPGASASGTLLPRRPLGARGLTRHEGRVDVLEYDLAGDDHAGDVVARGDVEHDRLQDLLEDRPQRPRAGAAQDRLVGDGRDGV